MVERIVILMISSQLLFNFTSKTYETSISSRSRINICACHDYQQPICTVKEDHFTALCRYRLDHHSARHRYYFMGCPHHVAKSNSHALRYYTSEIDHSRPL